MMGQGGSFSAWGYIRGREICAVIFIFKFLTTRRSDEVDVLVYFWFGDFDLGAFLIFLFLGSRDGGRRKYLKEFRVIVFSLRSIFGISSNFRQCELDGMVEDEIFSLPRHCTLLLDMFPKLFMTQVHWEVVESGHIRHTCMYSPRRV